jgi:hypothetical protein
MLQVWWISIALCGGAFSALAWLIAARQLRNRRAVARTALQTVLRDALLAHLGGADAAAGVVHRWRGRARLAAEVLLQYIGLIGGAERAALVRVVRDAGLDVAIRRRAAQSGKAGRLACLEVLGCFDDPATQDVLRRATLSADADIRLAGWRALKSVGAAIGVADLLNQPGFCDAAPPLNYCEFVQQMAEADPAGAAAALDAPGVSSAVRERLVAAIGRTAGRDGAPTLLRLANDEDSAVRAQALRALASQSHALPVPLLLQAMLAEAWEVRAEAVAAVPCADTGATLPVVARLLDDESWRVRQKAAEVLIASGDGGLQRLQTAAQSGSARARLAASLALAERAAA